MCDYCRQRAVYLAYAKSATSGMTRLACRQHHDRAREDCSAVAPPTITELDAHGRSRV